MPEASERSTEPPTAPRPSPWRRWRSRRVVVYDDSMAPTLRPSDRLLVDRSAYRDRPPSVGDIVVFPDPAESSRWLVKRVLAVGPGRFYATRTGLGGRAPSDHDLAPPPETIEEVTLPERSVYVVGDARDRSRDGRVFGPVPLDALLGRAYHCYAPADRIREL